ncbi:MAG: twin transmembrane helix small protein [Pseudomonadota bacterium]
MTDDPLFILIAIACFIVLGVLATGLGGFGKGSGWAHENANRLMRWRIGAQFVAVVLIVIYFLLRNGGA